MATGGAATVKARQQNSASGVWRSLAGDGNKAWGASHN